jgi:adenine phosphoribosyltransferase
MHLSGWLVILNLHYFLHFFKHSCCFKSAIFVKIMVMITATQKSRLIDSIRCIPDFPRKGILFRDVTTMLKQPELLAMVVDETAGHYRDAGITRVVSVESRGFLTGGALACKLGAGIVPVRKTGKLPADTYSVTYDLEYGQDTLHIHRDALSDQDVVLLHDDLLATGGTALAAIELVQKFNVKQLYLSFLIELDMLKGRNRLAPFGEVFTLIHL